MKSATIVLALCATAPLAFADNADLAKKLSNPVASLISVPIQ
ncbi:MAG: transporter, partial [Hyphomicrobiales bacterium]